MGTSIEDRLGNIVLDIYNQHSNGKLNHRFLNLLELLLKYETKDFKEEYLEWMLKMKPEDIDAYINKPAKILTPYLEKVMANYEHADDLGVIVVPGDYIEGQDYNFILDEEKPDLYYQKKPIWEKNYPTPSYPLMAGCNFDVVLYRQIDSKETDSYERYLFMSAISEAMLGLYGLKLLYEQKGGLLVPGISYTSFEKPYHSLRNMNGERVVTSLEIDEDNELYINYDIFKKKKWVEEDYLVCFYAMAPADE